MSRPIRTLVLSTILAVGGWATPIVEAGIIYDISGTFGVDLSPTHATGLAGGSFSGTFTAPGDFSTYMDFGPFEIKLFDDAGSLFRTLIGQGLVNDVNSGYFDPDATVPGRGLMDFVNETGMLDSLAILQLEFNLPFNGTGAAIPYDPAHPNRSALLIDHGAVKIASAFVSPVPAPPAVILCATSGLIGLVRLGIRRSRRGRV